MGIKRILKKFKTFTYSNILDLMELKLLLLHAYCSQDKNTIGRNKPHILFIAEKWCDSKPNCGLSNNEHNLFGSLEISGLATQDQFHPDEYCLQKCRPFETALALKCIKSKPDFIILTWPSTPGLKTLKLIKEKIKIPLIALWWDSVNHMEEAESFLPFVELNIVMDSSTVYLQKTHQPEKYMPMWTPQDPRIFYNPNLERDFDISFIGTMANHPDRVLGISALRLNGIGVYQTGGQREYRLPINEYANIYRRSKIVLNFCWHLNHIAQYKGRVLEATLCGAMLLESENSETSKWFEPMVDYVPFKGDKDLVDKTKFYLSHEEERIKIAENGHRKAKTRYTGEIFWCTILNRILGTNQQ